MKSIAYVALTLAVVTAQSSAAANCMMELDRNDDGLISLDEARPSPKLSSLFVDLDSNGDGQLNNTELGRFEAIFDSGMKVTQSEL
jgi:hypothetical protein